jgi:hypothetical protein
MDMTARRLFELDYREPFHTRAEEHRKRAESLVRGMEVMARKFADLDVVPLDVLDRAERVIVQLHTANLLRLPTYRSLGEDE